ncbi:putative UDP-glucuronosyl/UDP-glucosyltransferase, UDP-glycosyltransferase family [Helianthus annuus]|nr:putative UDP-glucuronosyl/UDP-glucosyltransferase, UDP-glycosyltransferase family [Helianthus annuus]
MIYASTSFENTLRKMDTVATTDQKKPHVIFIPLPAQSHIKVMLKLAQVLHHKGLQITFVNTERIHKRMLNSGGLHCLDGSAGFRFETIPDGIPRKSEDDDGSDLLLEYVETTFLTPFLDLATKLPTPPSCIISDGFMSAFTIDAAQKLGIPVMLYWTFSACGFMCLYHIQSLVEKGLAPLKDESYLTNGYLDTIIDWIPGMEEIRLKDFNSVMRTTNPNDKQFTFCINATQQSHNVSHNIFHTFDALETSIVNVLSSMFPKVYTVGPTQLILNQTLEEEKKTGMSNFNAYSLWKEEPECLQWLESKEPNSVIYVNYGSFTVMSLQDIIEFGWGLISSNHYFLWIIRSDLVVGESTVLPPDFEEHVKKRGFVASWCPQEKVLNHPSVGGFLTHCGWGSTIESLSAGVPMICWPYLWDQLTNCRYICKEWEVGLEMGKEVKREEVKKLVNELMGDGDDKKRTKAKEWQEKAYVATGPNGSSSLNVNNLVEEIIMLSRS